MGRWTSLLSLAWAIVPLVVPVSPFAPFAAPASAVGGLELRCADTGAIVLTDRDIARYVWDEHRLELTAEGRRRWLSHVPLDSTHTPPIPKLGGLMGREFVWVLDGVELYRGRFWSLISSAWREGTLITDVMMLQRDGIRIEHAGRPGATGEGSPDPREHPALRAWLESRGLLAGGPPAGFDVREVAPGVHAVVRREPLGLANHANNVFIIGSRDVIVVDACFTLAATREVVAALRALTEKPVRWVVSTHWHDDHTFGNQVWRDAWPGVDFVAHARTREDLAGIAVANREGQVTGGPAALASFRKMLADGRGPGGAPLAGDERDAWASTIAIAQQYLDEMPVFAPVPPTVAFADSLTLWQDGRPVRLLHPGPGVTDGDLIVHLPDEAVVIAGDLVDFPFPFAYGSHPAGWAAALARIEALRPRVVVPGHGPPLAGAAHVATLRGTLATIVAHARDAAARGESEAQAWSELGLDEARAALGAGQGMARYLFETSFARPAARAAYLEVTGGS